MKNILAQVLNLVARFRYRNRLAVQNGERSSFALFRTVASKDNQIRIGDDSIVHSKIAFDRPGALVKIGNRCYIGKSLLVAAKEIELADDVIISWGVTIVDHDSHSIHWEEREKDILDWGKGKKDWSNVNISKVFIDKKVWIGFNSVILKGVEIGEGSVVGSNSVVTKSVPPYVVVAGNPARIVKELS